jgi:hypothetical protein
LLIAFRFLFSVILLYLSFCILMIQFPVYSFAICSHFHLICRIPDDFENHYIQINVKYIYITSLLVFTSLTIFCVGCFRLIVFHHFCSTIDSIYKCVFVHYIYYIS